MKIRQFTWIPALSSVLMLILAVALAAHVRLGLGHWPAPMAEFYDSGMFDFHEWVLVFAGAFAMFGALPAWVTMQLFEGMRSPPRTGLIQVGVFFAGWFLFLIFLKIDYRNVVTWYLD